MAFDWIRVINHTSISSGFEASSMTTQTRVPSLYNVPLKTVSSPCTLCNNIQSSVWSGKLTYRQRSYLTLSGTKSQGTFWNVGFDEAVMRCWFQQLMYEDFRKEEKICINRNRIYNSCTLPVSIHRSIQIQISILFLKIFLMSNSYCNAFI